MWVINEAIKVGRMTKGETVGRKELRVDFEIRISLCVRTGG